ncbi:MAG: MFS transporter [Gammaproteobacteria bacterium]|nr:MFS transporter [Gammaproteobacteria bacterium]
MNTVAFAVNFAVWTMFSVIGIKIKDELGLNNTEFGLLVATPILTGSLVRLPLGLLTDRFGGRIVYFIQMILVAIPTYGLSFATEYWQYLVIGLFVGLAGGSFAIGIAYTSAWFPKERQGTAMGIFGAGNAGAAITNLVAPIIVVASGWRAVPEVYSFAMLVMAVLFWFTTYPDPLLEARKKNKTHIKLAQQLAPLAEARVWRFGLAYYFVFGGFVALALWLPKYYVGEYGLSLQEAALITMFFTLPSGLIRALGGWMSDKWGGDKVTWIVFWVSIVCLFLVSYPQTTLIIHGIEGDVAVSIGVGMVMFTILIFIIGIAQGIGKASVYRSLADYYPNNMGSVGGMVGVIGGLGGFTLPIMFGIAADMIGVRSSCFMLMYVVLAGVMIWTWAAARGEREAILQEKEGLRAELVRDGLLSAKRGRRVWLSNWRPEDDEFWKTTGRAIANRNLWLSMPALLLSFAVWVVWSVVVVELPKAGFQFSTSELFWLAALPGLSGALLRMLYSFMVPIFGGRNWAVFSTASLLLPTLWMSLAVQNPETHYAIFVVIALLCGVGGGNFSSSMANISFFFPKRMQGAALGLNAGVGNLGVAVAQAVVPMVIYGGALFVLGGESQTVIEAGVEKPIWLQNAGYIWVPFILLSTFAAWFGMNNIRNVQASFSEQTSVFTRKHAWLGSWLYTGTFGSFIGFAVGLPMLLATQFPDSGLLKYAFVGPLLGALVRPLGGWLSDRMGGVSLTFWSFAVMAIAMFGVLLCLPDNGNAGNASVFYMLFLLLFLMAGVGNGSVFHMIPNIFHTIHQRWSAGQDEARKMLAKHQAETESAVALGFSASIAALGGFFIPIALAISTSLNGNPYAAMVVFGVFYLSCMWVAWGWYDYIDTDTDVH